MTMSDGVREAAQAHVDRQASIEATLDEKVSALLESTAAIAANDARDAARRRALWIVGTVVTLVLAGLVSIQVQLITQHAADKRQAYSICTDRNRQATAIVTFIKKAQLATNANPDTTEAEKQGARNFYDTFLQDFGPVPDCSVYKH